MTHSSKPDEEIYFVATLPHFLKDLKSLFLNNGIFIPGLIACKHQLPTAKKGLNLPKF